MPTPLHKALLVFCPAAGSILGAFLGLYLVHGWPAKGEFGWPVVAACAILAFVGFLAPSLLLRLAPASCQRCGGRAFLHTTSTFWHRPLAQYSYRCTACGHDERADFSNP